MAENNSTAKNKTDPQENGHDARVAETIQAWMVTRLSEELKLAPAELDIRMPLMNYGLDSIVAFTLTGELADRLGHDLPATFFWDYPTIEILARHLADEIKDGEAAESLLAEMDDALSRAEEPPEDEILKSDKQQK